MHIYTASDVEALVTQAYVHLAVIFVLRVDLESILVDTSKLIHTVRDLIRRDVKGMNMLSITFGVFSRLFYLFDVSSFFDEAHLVHKVCVFEFLLQDREHLKAVVRRA